MNYVEQRLSNLLITTEKYSVEDLHKIKNCLCFIRDSISIDDILKGEKFLNEFIKRKENDCLFDVKELELEYMGLIVDKKIEIS